ncbi:MAG: type II toxin-antitoxin system VapC family toxin [Acetobacteraceae bacterium]|nr:type II toxin-antitoxin system VapC family toxin [Acetobacteraceae bacterium]
MSFALDSSVALAWCFEDEQTPAIMALLDRVVATGAMAPLLWPLEALNGLLVAERRRRLEPAKRAELAGLLRALPIMLDDETADKSWEDTLRLAERFTLSVYDATYLELAQRRRLPLASMDRALRNAAAALGVEVLLD